MADRGLFVDFLYAVTVGAALPRINDTVLHASSPVLWGVVFLIAVFLEDFYLYHVKIVPNLAGPHNWSGFSLSVLIIGTWYLTQAAFPHRVKLFLLSFAALFALRMVGGLLHRATIFPARQDLIFTLPIVAALVLLEFSEWPYFSGHPGHLLVFLFPIWLLTTLTWWFAEERLASESKLPLVAKGTPGKLRI
ncbi:MAG TPA: hypothetical protein VHY56_11440 [Candidatus Binataceae bacterium]|jgi:hypothetical protein|nr:hypothetical protein [Candidatus Binataceae bacterium]